MNILVTGANGQLGNEMRRVSLDSRNRYLFTDVNELDITDATAVCNMLKKEQIDVIVNCAAYTNVDRAEDDFAMADLLNNKAVENLAVAAAETGATLIHVSTDYVFRGDKNIPCRDGRWQHPTDVKSRHGISFGRIDRAATPSQNGLMPMNLVPIDTTEKYDF